MTKTALQQLIEKLRICTNIHKIETGGDRSLVDIEDVILLIKEELPTEKQQMEDAWEDGHDAGHSNGVLYDMPEAHNTNTFTDYHTKTYQDEK